MSLFRLDSIGTRLALGNGALLVGLMLVSCAVFYYETVGVLTYNTDSKIVAISNRLRSEFGQRPVADLVAEIGRELTDGIDSDTEIFLVTSPDGQRVAGNLSRWPRSGVPIGRLVNRDVMRLGRPSSARLLVQPLPHGGLLYVGRDLGELQASRLLVIRALEAAIVLSLGLVVLGAWLSRRQIERRIGAIRQTALQIESGKLEQRIPVSGDDEFARLGVDINRMLDRIERLMSGVRHVSNAIAHDLRTPLSRVRARLDEALRQPRPAEGLGEAARTAIEGIDDLLLLLNKLLQIAEAESGMRTATGAPVNLTGIAHDMAELYDAAADDAGIALSVAAERAVWTRGDRDLLATAVANLIDNALKYAGRGAHVEVSAQRRADTSLIVVRDDGPGVPPGELARLAERFYRLDDARHLPGNGLGLAIVAAIAKLHGGELELTSAAPGLRASLVLPLERAPDSVTAVTSPPAAVPLELS
jgi:signal transduction histidine kinase